MLKTILSEIANDAMSQLVVWSIEAPDEALDQPLTVTVVDRRRQLQVVVTVASYVPMKLDDATIAKIRELADPAEWPDEVVSLTRAVALA
jgi:hypothetical protein